MTGNQYVALLRGINVGGSNLIKMSDLKNCFEQVGFGNVETYIQSGNVLFWTKAKGVAVITNRIESALSARFKHDLRVVVIPHSRLRSIVKVAPRGFGKDPDRYRYDVIFLKEPLSTKSAIKQVMVKEGVDTIRDGEGVLYFSRLIAKASQSRLSRITSLPLYQYMTIRNWNTTTKLLSLLDRRAEE